MGVSIFFYFDDIEMPLLDSIGATKKIRERFGMKFFTNNIREKKLDSKSTIIVGLSSPFFA